MDKGKACAQSAHAARLSLLNYIKSHPNRLAEFLDLKSAGSMVVLDAPSLQDLDKLSIQATRHNLPWWLFVDSGHILPPHFDGSPIPTALAIGPAAKSQIRPLVRAYRCL